MLSRSLLNHFCVFDIWIHLPQVCLAGFLGNPIHAVGGSVDRLGCHAKYGRADIDALTQPVQVAESNTTIWRLGGHGTVRWRE